ncbi:MULTISPECIES: glucans biosynthesis glucosyltransferase MdoH [unclassified Gilliamella]|uniref:glucans biosynthesis glucosyltransferase MdoH n=1 Tax=unclassified Gilliamella TaxID=2685620 RepID=UPI001C6A68F1|nr:glucans biosynthesis glucosyltransferase MdoH [Gilliamella sp. ESL0441]QYN44791.1 glucans biosynthesis glucosyltransferase MdoH [Gilliamella sp. ESL0441]
MKKNYFSNTSDTENWCQIAKNSEMPSNDAAFLKYRLNKISDTETFIDDRQQLPTYPKLERVPVQPQLWNKPYKAKLKPKTSLIALFRRLVMFFLIVIQTYVGTSYLSSLLPYQSWQKINFMANWELNPELAIYSVIPYIIQGFIIALFAILFLWISIGFWTSIMGLILAIIGKDRYTIPIPSDPASHIDNTHRTALVMPICNEDVARVFAGLEATYQSLVETGHAKHCDFYILSDTNDPDLYINELKAWTDFNAQKEDNGCNIFYRHRKRRVKRKSGNIDDFCRRWGHLYEYMMILDADSIMTGDCILKMIAMMEMTPNAGILQSPPKSVRMKTLYGRIQQFANQIYSDIFCSGTHFWQLNEAQYWGHNAMIRLKPFIEHCILSPLQKRKGPLHILSHDLVEASLMRRAGYGVWIAYNLHGSFEELPGNMIEDLKRDNRWCMGNLINLRLIFKSGITLTHRVMFATSGMAYISSLLWLVFLIFSTLLLLVFNFSEPQYFYQSNQFYPTWPKWDEQLAIRLLSTTLILLFAPKFFSYGIILVRTRAKDVGGIFKLTLSIIIEMIWSMILAPIRMIFHSKFVVKAWLGSKIQWKSPSRNDDSLTWGESFYFCWPLSLLGIVWLGVIIWLNPQFTYWYIAILIPLTISPLVIRISGLSSIGMKAKKAGLFLTPEETHPARVVELTGEYLVKTEAASVEHGFIMALIDPVYNALACALSTSRHLKNDKNQLLRDELIKHYENTDLEKITKEQQLAILEDPFILSALHCHVWQQQERYDNLFLIWQNERQY